MSPSAFKVSQDVADFEAASEISPQDPPAFGVVNTGSFVLIWVVVTWSLFWAVSSLILRYFAARAKPPFLPASILCGLLVLIRSFSDLTIWAPNDFPLAFPSVRSSMDFRISLTICLSSRLAKCWMNSSNMNLAHLVITNPDLPKCSRVCFGAQMLFRLLRTLCRIFRLAWWCFYAFQILFSEFRKLRFLFLWFSFFLRS